MLTVPQLQGWARHYSCHPWGGRAQDLQFAALRRMIAAVAGAKNVGGLEAFMLHPPPRRAKSPEEMLSALDAALSLAP